MPEENGNNKQIRNEIQRFKLVVVGDGACGKTSILTKFTTGEFPLKHIPTVFETAITSMVIDEKEIELTLWDTAGQESYDRLRPLSYSQTDVILICFSIDSPDSLSNVEPHWAKEVKHFCRGVPVILVGNKIDLRNDQDTIQNLTTLQKEPITSENTRLVAKKIHAHHSIECSAKTGENIDKLFEMAGRAAMAHRRRRHTSRVSKWPFSHCNVL